MIDLEHCTILGSESVDANSINRCLFNIYNKIGESSTRFLEATSDNLPEFPFFSGGYYNALEDIDYISALNIKQATTLQEGVVPRLYHGELNTTGSQNKESFSTESVTGTYYYNSEQLSSFAPTVSSLYDGNSPLILKSILDDDESHMSTGVSSLGTASAPIVKFTSYLTCSNAGVSFGTVTFKRNNGDQQENVISLNIIRDLIGIDGVGKIDFFTIGNGVASGVKTVSEDLDMISEISPCNITYISENDVIISNITKNDNSDSIRIDKKTGRILDDDEESIYGNYVELSNDESVLNFFIMFTLKEDALKYSNDLWCFYIVNDYDYGKRKLYNASNWATNYFKYTFENFEAADDGKELPDGRHDVDWGNGCTTIANDAFNGCYNASFDSLCWISPAMRYCDRMFKGCTHATFKNLPNTIFPRTENIKLRSAISMFQNCMSAPFSNITTISIPTASRLGMMFAGCSNATFDNLTSINIAGDVTKMFYNDYKSDFLNLEKIYGSGIRFKSMFEGCSNAEFPKLSALSSNVVDTLVEAESMFKNLEKPKFDKIERIDFAGSSDEAVGYNGTSMFEGCVNANFEKLSSFGNLVNGERMFYGIDTSYMNTQFYDGYGVATFSKVSSFGNKFLYGNSMFENDYYLSMNIVDSNNTVQDGTSMFKNTSSVIFNGNLSSLNAGDYMFSNTLTSVVKGDINNLKTAQYMFHNCVSAEIDGQMNKLSDAYMMFNKTSHVKMHEFPESVEKAIGTFSEVESSCDIESWGGAKNDRYCIQSFSNSNNIKINGDILKGKIVSTTSMFENASMSSDPNYYIRIVNSDMESETDSSHRYYSSDAGENFAYIQKYDSDDATSDGDFTFIGNANSNNISSYITSSYVASSLACFVRIRNKSIVYDLYSVGGWNGEWNASDSNGAVLIASDLSFDTDTEAYSGNYFYAPVSGISDYTKTYEAAINYSIDRDNQSITSYTLYSTEPSHDDLRTFSITSIGVSEYSFKSVVQNNPPSVIYEGKIEDRTGSYLITVGNATQSVEKASDSKIYFDFAQYIPQGTITPKTSLIIRFEIESTQSVNRYFIEPNSIVNAAPSTDGKMLIRNSTDSIKTSIIPVMKYGYVDIYGYLMRYIDSNRTINMVSFSKDSTGESRYDMIKNPKAYLSESGNHYTVTQIFDGNMSGFLPPSSLQIQTSFSIGAAEMGGYWKYANSMFHNVIQDSLLSSYACFIDTSLLDTSKMFKLDYYYDGDGTFRNTGYIFQNMSKSNIKDMSEMFMNRCICEASVFKDLYVENNEDKISFLIPNTVENATSAFLNTHLSSSGYDEIGLTIPNTLTGAVDMFRGYQGPDIRFGYNSNGYIEIADGIECNGMFYGCTFANSEYEKFAFSVPSIYVNMFEGSNFNFNNISSLTVRNGMNFANPYSNEEYFYNDSKLLGCSSMSFDSLKTDVLDWFVSNTNDVEGVYLATVIGPSNYYTEDGKYVDYRLMSADRNSGYWRTYMSDVIQFKTLNVGDEESVMESNILTSTNDLNMNECTEIENTRGRMTCMFNPALMFKYSNEKFGDRLYSLMSDSDYSSCFNTVSSYSSKCYNSLVFDDVSKINAIEMPFAFCGMSGATFDSLNFIGDSAIVGYGAFMGCSSATFSSLSGIRFIQNENYNTFTSRFADSSKYDVWFGNYDNMFSNCENATFGNLNSVMMNSKYDILSNGDRVLVWYDFDNNINYMTYSNFDYRFSFSFNVSSDGGIHIGVADRNRNNFFDYNSTVLSSDGLSAELRGYKDVLEDNVLARIFLKNSGGVVHEFNIDTLGYINSSPEYIQQKYIPFTEDSTVEYKVEELADTKYLVVYHNADGYHIIPTDENLERNNNHRIVFTETASATYEIELYNNNNIDITEKVFGFITDVAVDKSCQFKVEMSEINGTFTPIITITDKNNALHFYEILADSSIEQLKEHPQRGVTSYLGLSATYPFMNNDGTFIDASYSDNYGQNYTLRTTMIGDKGHYSIVLKDIYNDNLITLETPLDSSIDMKRAFFSLGSYNSNNTDCIVVAVYSSDDMEAVVYYKIYKDVYDNDKGKSFQYVEETMYKPGSMDYRLVESIDLNSIKTLSHKAYCSGMFSNNPKSTFSNLDTICIPMSGSCTEMFGGDENATLTSIKYFVLPTSIDSETKDGFGGYRGLFNGIHTSSVNFSNLKAENTNMYMIGRGSSKTIAKQLFYGMIDSNGNRYDDTFRCFGKTDARNIGLDNKIINRMDFNDGTTKLIVNISTIGDTFTMAVQMYDSSPMMIEWGDGSAIETYTGLSEDELTEIQHTYNSVGNFQIRISNDIKRIVIGEYSSYTDSYFMASLGEDVDEHITSVDSFGEKIENLSFAFNGCVNLRTICDWNGLVRNVGYCYYNCNNVEGDIVRWGDSIVNCQYCYYGCKKLSDVFSSDTSELMPSRIVTHDHCVTNASNSVRKQFFSTWGGTNELVNANIVNIDVSDDMKQIFIRAKGIDNDNSSFIDWGDGSLTETTRNYMSYSHAYESNGSYIIAISNTSKFNIGDSSKEGDYSRSMIHSGDSIRMVFGLEEIDARLFYNLDIATINIPESVTYIGSYAFGNCQNINSMYIPNSVVSIGDYCFTGCTGLNSFTIPNSVNSVGIGVFSNCTSLTSVNFTESVTKVPNYCFNGCDSLERMIPPSSISEFGSYCFKECDSLSELPSSVSLKRYGSYCFYNCNGLTDAEIPSTIERIGDYCFMGCSELTSVNIPDSVTYIGKGSFYECSKLDGIELPNTTTEIPMNCFRYCSGITSFTIPDSVTSLGNYCFSECYSMSSIDNSDYVEIIGDSSFYGCSSLYEITIPSSTTSIGRYCFRGCAELSSMEINRTTAPTVFFNTFGDTKDNCTGSRTATADINTLKLPVGYTGYGVGAWSDVLLNASKSNFTITTE